MLDNFYRGDTLEYTLNFTDNTNTPLNITNAKIFFTLKENPSDSDNQAKIQIVQTEHINALNGQSKIIVPASLTDTLEPNKTYFYDFQIVFSNGTVKTVNSGKVKVLQDITRRTL